MIFFLFLPPSSPFKGWNYSVPFPFGESLFLYIWIPRPESALGQTGSPLGDQAVYHEPCPPLDIFNRSLKRRHAEVQSQRECSLLSPSPGLFWCLQVTLLHPSALHAVASAGISCGPGAGLAAGPGWQKVHLHSSTSALALALIRGCSWQTAFGERTLLVLGHLRFEKALFSPPISFFPLLFWLFLLLLSLCRV